MMFNMLELWNYLVNNLEDEAERHYLSLNCHCKEMLYYGSSNTLFVHLECRHELAEAILRSLSFTIERYFGDLLSCKVIVIYS